MSQPGLLKAAMTTVRGYLKKHGIGETTAKDKRLNKFFAEQLWWLELSAKDRATPAVKKHLKRMSKTHTAVLRNDKRLDLIMPFEPELLSITDRFDAELKKRKC